MDSQGNNDIRSAELINEININIDSNLTKINDNGMTKNKKNNNKNKKKKKQKQKQNQNQNQSNIESIVHNNDNDYENENENENENEKNEIANEDELKLSAERIENQKKAIVEMENEKNRRMHEEAARQVKEDLLQEYNKNMAIHLAEEERLRRIQELNRQEYELSAERQKNQLEANDAMEEERTRRVTSPEHMIKMQQISPKNLPPKSASYNEIQLEKPNINETLESDLQFLPIESRKPEEELKALNTLKKDLADDISNVPQFEELVGDVRLMRFLRGEALNPKKAAQNYRKCLKWRENNNMDQIREQIVNNNWSTKDFPGYEQLVEYIPFVNMYDVVDRNGNMITYERTGYVDTHGLMENVSDTMFFQFYLYELEYRAIQLDKKSREAGKMIRTTVIRNFEGLTFSQAKQGINRLKKAVTNAAIYYPETAASVYLINTPWYFPTFWSIAKFWFNKHQLRKFHFIKNNGLEKIYEIVVRENLPLDMGGNNESIKVPHTGLLKKSSYENLLEMGGHEAEIKNGGSLQLPFILKENEIITWEFILQSYDILFEVKFRTQGDGGAIEETVVNPLKLKNGNVHTGSWKSVSSGTVVLVWNNSFSWTRKKHLVYKTDINSNFITN